MRSLSTGNLNKELSRIRLDKHLATNQLFIKNLQNTRGFHWTNAQYLNQQILTAALRDYDPSGKTALLFYHIEADTLYSYLLSAEKLLAQASVPITNLSGVAIHPAEEPSSTAKRGGKVSNTGSDRLQLTQCLLPPDIAIALQSNSGIERLLIAPESSLSTLPFAQLTPFGDTTLLIERMSIAIVPSLSDLLAKIHYYDTHVPGNGNAVFDPLQPLIVGDPDYTAFCTSHLQPLPYTSYEAQTIATLLGTKPLLGQSATPQAVEQAILHADFIHIATHGFSSPNQSLDSSYLALTSTSTHCGLWTARSIQRLKLSGEALVVLSACETGQGQVHEGGIIGLARAFQLAGASNILMSLWPVPDRTTADFMIQFVQELKKPAPFFPASHLRQIMLSQRKAGVSVDTWGAFVCFGVPYPPRLQMKIEKP
ncbi:CHAT domain-containing protein [Fibrella sp. WM1]|uniref:CHAT domain-containing protein n=1 Tax=Fibrella musci TaxID=3242485 RepID=UPI0035228243